MHGNIKRILIVKPSSLGDIVHTLPLAHALKRCFPACSLGWIVQDTFTGLLECDPAIDVVYPIHISSTSEPGAGLSAYLLAFKETLKTFQRLHRRLKGSPYDFVLDLHASFRSGMLGKANPGGTRIGLKGAKELNTLFQQQLVTVPDQVVHAVDKNLLFAHHLNCTEADEDFYMCCSEEDNRAVQRFLQHQGITGDKPVIYANPAARWQTKFWPRENWSELADRLMAFGAVVIFGGSNQDRTYLDSIARKMRTAPCIAAGSLSLMQSVALIQRSSLYVGLDSGPMHIAALSGTPVVALFGPTHPERVGPYGVPHLIVRNEDLDCLECRKRSCDHLSCMKGISVKMVYNAATALLQDDRQRNGNA